MGGYYDALMWIMGYMQLILLSTELATLCFSPKSYLLFLFTIFYCVLRIEKQIYISKDVMSQNSVLDLSYCASSCFNVSFCCGQTKCLQIQMYSSLIKGFY